MSAYCDNCDWPVEPQRPAGRNRPAARRRAQPGVTSPEDDGLLGGLVGLAWLAGCVVALGALEVLRTVLHVASYGVARWRAARARTRQDAPQAARTAPKAQAARTAPRTRPARAQRPAPAQTEAQAQTTPGARATLVAQLMRDQKMSRGLAEQVAARATPRPL